MLSVSTAGHGPAHLLPSWLPTSISRSEAAFLADAISNLDEYGRQQNELVTPHPPFPRSRLCRVRELGFVRASRRPAVHVMTIRSSPQRRIVWALCAAAGAPARARIAEEVRRVAAGLAAAGAAYMDSVQRLIATDEFPAQEAQFDESLFYHFFQNVLRLQARDVWGSSLCSCAGLGA